MGFEDAFGILPCYFGMVKHFGGIRRGIAGNFQHFEADGNFMGGNRRNFQEIPATFGDSSRFFRRFLDYFRILKCHPPPSSPSIPKIYIFLWIFGHFKKLISGFVFRIFGHFSLATQSKRLIQMKPVWIRWNGWENRTGPAEGNPSESMQ